MNHPVSINYYNLTTNFQCIILIQLFVYFSVDIYLSNVDNEKNNLRTLQKAINILIYICNKQIMRTFIKVQEIGNDQMNIDKYRISETITE